MSVDTTALNATGQTGWLALSRQRLENGLLWFTMAISGVVLFEPAPFEFMTLILVGFWLVSGLHIPRSHVPLVALLGVLTATGLLAAWLSTTLVGSGRHIAISIFLYILTMGLAAFAARDPKRSLPIIMNGYTVAALIACIAAIVGYFGLIGEAGELFLSHERARGTLKDPNVFGPFIAVPMVYIFVQNLSGEERIGGLKSAILLLLGLGILLSFSRGAWVNLIFACGISSYLLFISARSNSLRLKVLGLTACIGVLSVLLVVAALSFDAIAELMSVRGKLLQSYDTSERFVGAAIALDVIFNNPLGIGAKSFKDFHSVEPHNVYLYSFLIGGWLGGFAYIALVISTIYVGFRATLRKSQIQLFAIVFFSSFLATALEGLIIDSDHWRHFYILIGCIWGIHAYLIRQDRERRTPVTDKPISAKKNDSMVRHVARPNIIPRTRARAAVASGLVPTRPSHVDLSFTPNTVLRRAWRRKLGQLKPNKISCQHTQAAPLEIPSMRTHFGLRERDENEVRTTFGQRRRPTS